MKRELYSLSPAQQYHLNLTVEGQPAPDINIAFAVFISAGKARTGVDIAIRAALQHHATLCAKFEEVAGVTFQRFVGANEIPITIGAEESMLAMDQAKSCDPSFLRWYRDRGIDEDAARHVAFTIAREKQHIFRLYEELPSRVTLVPHDNGATSAIFCFHHAAIDAPSLPLFLKTVSESLNGCSPTHTDFRYFDYADRKRDAYRNRRTKNIEYWLNYLGENQKFSDSSILSRRSTECRKAEAVIQVEEGMNAESVFASRLAQSNHLLNFETSISNSGKIDPTYFFTTTSNRIMAEEKEIVGCFYRHVIWNINGNEIGNSEHPDRVLSRHAMRHYQNMDVSLDDIVEAFFDRYGTYPALNASLQSRDVRGILRSGEQDAPISIVPYQLINMEDRIPLHLHISLDTGFTGLSLVYDPDFIDAHSAENLMGAVSDGYRS